MVILGNKKRNIYQITKEQKKVQKLYFWQKWEGFL